MPLEPLQRREQEQQEPEWGRRKPGPPSLERERRQALLELPPQVQEVVGQEQQVLEVRPVPRLPGPSLEQPLLAAQVAETRHSQTVLPSLSDRTAQ